MRRTLVAVSIFTLAACGGAPGPIDQMEPIDQEMEMKPDPMMEKPSNVDLAGTWALKVLVGQILASPLGEGPATVTTLSLVHAETSGTDVTFSSQMCSIALSPYQNATTTYPAATIASMRSEGIRGTARDGKFDVPAHAQLLGWRAGNDAMTEEIPANDDDTRVFDVERDGHPGATVSVESPFASGDVYVVGRTIETLNGTIVSEDRVEGRAAVDMQQEILDATNALLTIGEVSSRPDPDPSVNTFTMIRLDAQADCSAVIRGF